MKLFRDIRSTKSCSKVLVCSLLPRYDQFLETDGNAYARHYNDVALARICLIGDLLAALQKGYDIIHLLCLLSSGGIVRDRTEASLTGTDLITRCCENRVKLLWIASENSADDYVKGFHVGSKPINLIMTMRRNGTKFQEFLDQLVAKVSRGESLPVAWAKLVPQAEGPWQQELPSCIFSAGMPRADLSSNNRSSKPS